MQKNSKEEKEIDPREIKNRIGKSPEEREPEKIEIERRIKEAPN
jgi:hypothetical protein